jgi:hypothetical protein
MAKSISRRILLTGALSGATVMCLAGGVTILALDDRDMLRVLLREVIGPYRMSEAEFEKFRQGFKYRYGLPNRMITSAVAAAETTGAAASLIDLATESAASRYDRLKRNVLTEFLTRTDYLSGGAEAEVTYVGDQPCSPFARFDFA